MRALLATLSLLATLLLACGARAVSDGGMPLGSAGTAGLGPRVIFPSVTVSVELARTEAEHTKGLGGHAPLGEREGMLFIFDHPALYAFWMKGMTFPLDILWIEGDKVVHLEQNLPAPPPGAADSQLPVYTPAVPAQYVLEVNAGFARRYGILPGTSATIAGIS